MRRTITLLLGVFICIATSCQKDAPVTPKKNTTGQSDSNGMPVTFASFSGASGNGNITISFSTTFEKNVAYFEIFSGETGNLLCKIGKVSPADNGNNTSLEQYQFVDTQPKGNPTYYMIGYVCANDSTYYYDPVLRVAVSN